MKKAVTFLFALIFSLSVMGQNRLFSGQPKDSVVRLNPQMDQFNFVPGKLLVKFRDNVSINFKKSRKGLKSSQAFMNQLINKYGITDGERLFPNEKRLKSVQILTAPNGNKFERPSLNNIYILKIKSHDPSKLMESIRSLKADSAHVAYAEPDYIYSVTDDKAVSPVMTEKQAEQWAQSSHHSSKNVRAGKVKVVTPNDPLYSQQWWIDSTQVNQVWDTTTGDTTQIIGILDTGVDWKHPDLKNNIWRNKGEIPGNGIDDDGDGFVDDVRGWDFVNHDNNPMDDNSHGTHVAGIAAAEGNNGIGIAGVDWHARIMPIKVFQSDGRGDVATITKGIIYAANHGATVINMSFGSYARSLTMEAALENAYATCVLVAAAGNDGSNINPGMFSKGPFFPAALSYVIGVQATQQYMNSAGNYLARFSNFDIDGPVYSRFPDLLNYELCAPGNRIISTIPDGNYRVYSGTSMAAPLVSGSVALYRQIFPSQSQEQMWGNFINTTLKFFPIKLYDAIHVKPKPVINFVSNTIVDTLAGDNHNGLVDAGENIQLWFKVRNTWGQSDSIYVGLRLGEFEDTTAAQILKDTAFIGSISAYATRTNETNPLLIHINPKIANNRDIVLEGLLWYKGSKDTIKQKIVLTASHGTYLAGVMDSTMTLTPNYLWIVNSSFRIGINGTLNIKPGTKIILKKSFNNQGVINSLGNKDSLITIQGPGSILGAGQYNFYYTELSGMRRTFSWTGMVNYNAKFILDHCIIDDFQASGRIFRFGSTLFIKNSIIENSIFSNIGLTFLSGIKLEKNNISRCYFTGTQSADFKFNNISNISLVLFDTNPTGFVSSNSTTFQNNFLTSTRPAYIMESYQGNTDHAENNYWGTTDSAKIANKIYDFWDDASLAEVIYSPYLHTPSDSAHGIVWKVLVDSIDPQDQAKLMNPVGVGVHRFDVYFNRPMDTKYTPHLSFGVRLPYTQQAVADSASWSADSTIWTAYKTVKLLTGDGINRIRVSGARDPEGFEIPVEDMRFQFVISAAESASLDFMATPGLGKVNLEWNNSGIKDLLGFNMYRMEQLNDTTLSKPILINNKLILDTLYTDFQVVPNKKYFYFYKVVNTDFTESDSSRVVAAVPYTASLGDANGDLKVNVLDLTTIVAYILGKNPQPFIKAAADINADSTINILDVIGIVKMILGNKSITADNVSAAEPATIIMKDSTIQLQSNHQLAALQFELKGDSLSEVSLSLLLKGFEFSYGVVNGKIIGLIYSFNGNMIPGGLQNIIKITHAPGELKWGKVFGSDAMGHYVEVDVQTIDGIKQPIILENSLSASPNPFSSSVVLKYQVSRRAHVQMEVYNLSGQKVSALQNAVQNAGQYELIWNGKTPGNRFLPSGIYFCRLLIVPENGGHVFKKEVKLVMMR